MNSLCIFLKSLRGPQAVFKHYCNVFGVIQSEPKILHLFLQGFPRSCSCSALSVLSGSLVLLPKFLRTYRIQSISSVMKNLQYFALFEKTRLMSDVSESRQLLASFDFPDSFLRLTNGDH